jgi:catalase
MSDPAPKPQHLFWRWCVIGSAVLLLALAFGYVGGWLTPKRLTAQRMVDALQHSGGIHPGYRRNHAKGICVAGYFEGNSAAADYSRSEVFAAGRTPFVGRFAVPGGNPYAPDSSIPIRSMALRFSLANGQQWRTGMNSMPVFPVATPQAFYEQLQASQPDPATGKPDPARMKAFFGQHPETAAFLAWVKTARPSASYATESYSALNAFYFVDAKGMRHAVRWQVVPDAKDAAPGPAGDTDYLANDLRTRLAAGPLRWHLMVTLAAPDDPVDDATKVWPADRKTLDVGTLVIESEQAQESGPCRDINYDPTVLPDGIEVSGDPLLPARSAAYADSYLRRTGEEAHLPGSAHADQSKQEHP